jgi:hypothetical protein
MAIKHLIAGGKGTYWPPYTADAAAVAAATNRQTEATRATPGARSPPRRSTRGWSRRERKANGQRTSKWPNRPSPWPMLRNATVSEEDNHARFYSPAFRNRFHWWNG